MLGPQMQVTFMCLELCDACGPHKIMGDPRASDDYEYACVQICAHKPMHIDFPKPKNYPRDYLLKFIFPYMQSLYLLIIVFSLFCSLSYGVD